MYHILVKALEEVHAQKHAAWLWYGQGTLFLHGIGWRWGQGNDMNHNLANI